MTSLPTCHNATECLQHVEASSGQMNSPRGGPNLSASLATSLQRHLRAAHNEATAGLAFTSPNIPSRFRGSTRLVAPSALESHLCLRASQWQANVVEVLQRLEEDWLYLVEILDLSPGAALDNLSAPLGDPHNHGRSVFKLVFDDGRALIYKPRHVGTEHTFALVLQQLAHDGCQPALSACRAFPRSGYGWTEFVESTPTENEKEVSQFYWRQGGFLALFWLLGATDAIADNIVVNKSHPVWVDTECMFAPEIPYSSDNTKGMPAWIKQSILPTAMLVDSPGNIASLQRRKTGLSVSCTPYRPHVFSAGILKPPYADAVVHGFRDVYTWLLGHRDILSPEGGLLSPWQDETVRVVLRPTSFYATVLSWWLTRPPDCTIRSVEEELEEMLLPNGPRSQEIIAAEIRALQREDIPYWSASPCSPDLWDTEGYRVVSAATATGMECAFRRGARMSGTDLERQAWLISSYLGHSGRASTTLSL